MNNAKGNTKTDAKKKASKSGQSNTKSAKAKSASSAKGGSAKSQAAAPKASAKVFRVDVNKGPVRQVSRKDAVADALRSEAFTEETLNAMLDRGEVIPSPDYYYATTEKALSKWSVNAPPESKPLEIGDLVYSSERDVVGEIKDKDGTPRVFFTFEGHVKSVAVSAKWGRANASQIEAYKASLALVKDEAVEVEVIPAMTDEEKAELAERETVISTNLAAQENASMVIGENLDIIRKNQWFRESVNPETNSPFKNFGEYATAKFGLTREYAQNLAQISGYHQIAVDALPAKLKDGGLSVNTTNALVRSQNRLSKEFGLDEIEGFDELRPIIVGSMKILADVAPKNKRTGQAEVTPRLVKAVTDTINEIVKSGSVEIEGKQMSIADAAAKGVLGAATQNQVIEVVAEGIKANRQTIADEASKAYERSVTPAKPSAGSGPKLTYSGTVPDLGLSCDKHGATKVLSIGNGTFQTKCKCRWRIDAESAKLVCFEVNGKRVKTAE